MTANKVRDLYGPVGLVTGAASGIGAAFARRLAVAGVDLVLVDRDEAGLSALATELRERSGVTVTLCAGDLTDPDFVRQLTGFAETREVGLLVHSAGITSMGEFLEMPLEPQLDAVELHCRVTAQLLHAFGRPMRARGRGGLVLLSSNSAILRAPFVANYAATKAYTLALGEALYEELRQQGVDVLVLVPGMTDTPLFAKSQPVMERARSFVQSPEDVVDGALRALGRQPVYISSASDRVAANVLGAILPRKLALRLARRSMAYFFPHLLDKPPG
jgi:short-subunit dehydrogenase